MFVFLILIVFISENCELNQSKIQTLKKEINRLSSKHIIDKSLEVLILVWHLNLDVLHGHFKVNKVSGNFHFGPSKSFQHAHLYTFDLMSFTTESFNISHRVNQISFGDDFPGLESPLDGTERLMPKDEGSGMFQYYVQVVPTGYERLNGELTSPENGARQPPQPSPCVLHTPPRLVHVALSTCCCLPMMLQYSASHVA